MRRGLRKWFGERLEIEPTKTRELILDASSRTDLPQHFRDDCIVAALLSDSAQAFLDGCRERIQSGDRALFRRVLHLLRVACKTPPAWVPNSGLTSSFLIPTGPAWAPALELISNLLPEKPDGDAFLFLGILEDWARQINIWSESPPGAEAAGRIATALLPLFEGYGFEAARKRLLRVILLNPRHTKAFEQLVGRALADDRSDHTAEEFVDKLVSTESSAFACRDYPDEVIRILKAQLMLLKADP